MKVKRLLLLPERRTGGAEKKHETATYKGNNVDFLKDKWPENTEEYHGKAWLYNEHITDLFKWHDIKWRI